MQRYILTFGPRVTKEERAKVMQHLEKMGVNYAVGTNNTRSDARRGIVPQVDYISILWDGFGNFLGSEICRQLPEGCTIDRR